MDINGDGLTDRSIGIDWLRFRKSGTAGPSGLAPNRLLGTLRAPGRPGAR